MARRKLPADTVVRLLPCQRWGVCAAGTADIGAVEIQTVHRFQRVAAHRAAPPHRQRVQHVAVQGGPWDAAHAQLRLQQGAWVQTACALGRGLLRWGDFGPRTHDTAATLSAQVVARAQPLPVLLTAGGKASTAVLLQVVGVV